ncbi:hypothetical protein [Aestuariicoccus sp. MJ-SS9]|uniref:hypothetical protein n=1 Tax=Aestuariicoccus sp. MJ-SS9 TaxID=3079855 RepID=UPI00292E07FE|nr:hypothetical protein [Aestuariicoccus sp. MJ-SS9]
MIIGKNLNVSGGTYKFTHPNTDFESAAGIDGPIQFTLGIDDPVAVFSSTAPFSGVATVTSTQLPGGNGGIGFVRRIPVETGRAAS